MFLLSSANGDMWLTTANQAANLSVSIIPRESEFLPVQQYLEKNKLKKLNRRSFLGECRFKFLKIFLEKTWSNLEP